MHRGLRGAAAGLLAVLPVCAQTQPTFYAAYEDGLEAAKQGRWHVAAEAFQRAAALRPAPAARVIIYGNNLLTDYYPNSHLARCRLELGEREAAAVALREAEVHGEPAALREPLQRRLLQGGDAQPAGGGTNARASMPHPAAPEPAPGPGASHAAAPTAGNSSGPDPSVVLAHSAQVAGSEGGPVPTAIPAAGERKSSNVPPAPSILPPTQPPVNSPPPAPADPLPAKPQGPTSPSKGQQPVSSAAMPQAETIRPLAWKGLGAGAGLLLLLAGGAWVLRRSKEPVGRGAGSAETDSAQAPERVGPYEITRILGHGGFATTYLAYHGETGKEVALKVLHPHRLHDTEFTRRFALEAKLGALLDHPSLVRLLDPGTPGNTSWIALEYVPGPTLEKILKERGRLPVEEAVSIALVVAQALTYAHANGVVHRDLKPGNIIFGKSGPKVMDLGIAREMDSNTLTTTYAFLGTPLYASPESQMLAKIGPASDRYSLGVMLFEMIAGRPPFLGETPFAILEQHRTAPVPDITAFQEVPEGLVRLLNRVLDKDPELRPEDGELVAKLERILNVMNASLVRAGK